MLPDGDQRVLPLEGVTPRARTAEVDADPFVVTGMR